MESKNIEFKKQCHSCRDCIPENQSPMCIRRTNADGNLVIESHPQNNGFLLSVRACAKHLKWVSKENTCEDIAECVDVGVTGIPLVHFVEQKNQKFSVVNL